MVKRSDAPKFESEAALVAAFCACLERDNQNPRMAEDEKWTLAQRNGVLTPVHRHCDNPNSYYPAGQAPVAPAPLLEWRAA